MNEVMKGTDMEGLKRRTVGFSLECLDEDRRMMLLETGGNVCGSGDGEFLEALEREAQGARFDCLNLNPQECVLFFLDEAADWKELAGRLNAVLTQTCGPEQKSYISVSSGLKDRSQIADRYQELELQMENRFYDLEGRVYMAKNEAESYRESVETELEEKRQEEARKFELARFKVAGYLESLNRSQNKLLEVYEEFGRVVERLPLRIGDVFSDEPF